jgi:tRNA(fMet)-specific endonuclease VapC
MKYLLDADTISYLVRQDRTVWKKALQFATQWCISSLTVWELRNWKNNLSDPAQQLLEQLLLETQTLNFDFEDANVSSAVKWDLRKSGLDIGTIDVLVAGQAIAKSLILVTNNTKHFSAVPSLRIENWLK